MHPQRKTNGKTPDYEHLPIFQIEREIADVLVKLIAPIAPHFAEELWSDVLEGTGFISEQAWPTFDPEGASYASVLGHA